MKKEVSSSPPPRRLVIGIAGRIGAGKTTAARHLASTHGFKYLRYSQVLAREFGRVRKRDRLRALGWEVMSGGKQQELNRLLIRRIGSRGNYVVDGLRHPIDFQSLKKRFPGQFRLVYIVAPVSLRWRRLRQAGRFDTMMDFRAGDRHPVEANTPLLRSKASVVIHNDGSPERLLARLDKAVNRMRRGGRP